MTSFTFLAMCAICVFCLLHAELRKREDRRRLFKSSASLSFVLVGIAAGALASSFGQLILTGLILCAIGDALLLGRSDRLFLMGMGAFAAGHAAYVGAFLAGGVAWTTSVGVAAAIMAASGAGMILWLRRDLGLFAVPVAAYAAIISAMVVASVAHAEAAATGKSVRLAVAAGAFALSDVAVARDRFKQANFVNRLWGLPLYYAAQCLFAISV